MRRNSERKIPQGRKRRRNKSVLPAVLCVITGIFAIFYFGMAIYFAGHFGFNTKVNGEEAYSKTVKDLENEFLHEAEGYSLIIKGRNGVEGVITSSQVSLSPQFGSEFKDILRQQNAFLWPVTLFKETNFETSTVVAYSKPDLESVIAALPFFNEENITEPQNAHLNETENGFEVAPENPGSTPIKERVIFEIEEAVNILANEITLSDDCFEKAEILKDDTFLNELKDNLNVYCSAHIVYNFGADQIVVGAEKIKEWCTIDGTTVTLNEERVKAFVDEMARAHDSFGKTRSFKTQKGETIEVSGGDYGWWMNRPQEKEELIAAIKNGEKGERHPVYFQEANSYDENDMGNSYVEIDLDSQHLWVHKDGQVVEESDFVSGCVNKRTTTPTGTYSITYKERDATLVGQGYSSPVSYWMPFNGNVGMHDASWRSKFGGELYVTGGSHGCINLPKKKAESIYEIVSKGMPVIVYGGKVLPEPEEEPENPDELTPEQQLLLLQQAGLLNENGESTVVSPESQPESQSESQE